MTNDGGNERDSDDGEGPDSDPDDGGNGSRANPHDGERSRSPEDGESERDPGDAEVPDPDEGASEPDESRQPSASAVSLSLDETLELLANYERRRILGYLMNASDATATADELVDHLVTRQAERTGERPGRSHVATTLHHVHLPKLADAGVVDYDARSQEVRYWRDERLERWYDCIRERERS